jgi:hypothetical protein
MSSPTQVTEPISVNRNYRSEALKPGGVVMNANFILTGDGAYGQLIGQIRLPTWMLLFGRATNRVTKFFWI